MSDKCIHEAWEENGGWRRCVDCGYDWSAPLHAARAQEGRHHWWGAGEADCPKEIKGGNGELHTMRCKVCGTSDPDAPCAQPQATSRDAVDRVDSIRRHLQSVGAHKDYLDHCDALTAALAPPVADAIPANVREAMWTLCDIGAQEGFTPLANVVRDYLRAQRGSK